MCANAFGDASRHAPEIQAKAHNLPGTSVLGQGAFSLLHGHQPSVAQSPNVLCHPNARNCPGEDTVRH